MSQNLKIQVLLSAIDKLTAPFRDASAEAQKLAKKLESAKNAEKKLADKQKLIDSYKKLKLGLNESGQKLKEAQEKAKQLAQQFNQTAEPTKK
ncbi:hypothetical protein A1D22_01020 [Pasteurellaceae bacterium LFhippo2]|nr:hypothetical protein [Pasteurellaceae bacterium LFhippo2]